MLPKEFDIQALRIVETYDEIKKNSMLDDDLFITSMINYRDTYIHVLTNASNFMIYISFDQCHEGDTKGITM